MTTEFGEKFGWNANWTRPEKMIEGSSRNKWYSALKRGISRVPVLMIQ